jgi:hypothetical protein
MLRLPVDVARALRRRAATADITIAEAARQLMLPRQETHPLGLLDHVEWLHGRLLKRREDLIGVFDDAMVDSRVVDRAIDALVDLRKEWPDDQGEEYDFTLYGPG